MMSTETKRFVAAMQFKALDEEDRTFEAYAATWDLDLQMDVIQKGAFKRWIRTWKKEGGVLPLLDSHSWFSIFDTVGKLLDVEERDQGLWTRWKVIPGPRGDEVLRLLSTEDGGPFIDSMSIGYQPVKWYYEDDPQIEGREIRYLQEIGLNEVSLVRFPANPQALTDPESVRKALKMDLETLEKVVGAATPEVRMAVKGLLQQTIERCEGEHCRSRDDPPAPRRKDASTVPASKSVDDEDDDPNAPDATKLDQLRLRQLEFRTHKRGVYTHG
jgi:HK97 family phage prohead protease